mgnify:CR=1 FL=1
MFFIKQIRSYFKHYVLRISLVLSCLFSGYTFSDDNDFRDWSSLGSAIWSFKNEELIGREGDGFFLSNRIYGEFELSVEFWISADTNSGIFILCQDRGSIHPESCYELNIWDSHPNQDARTGSIVGRVMPPLAEVATQGRWNRYHVIVRDSTITVKVNDILTAILKEDKLQTGFIALQKWGAGEVRFRNLKIN